MLEQIQCKHKYVNVRSSINNLRKGSQSAHRQNLYSTVNTHQKTFSVSLVLKPADNQSVGNNHHLCQEAFADTGTFTSGFHLAVVTPSVTC